MNTYRIILPTFNDWKSLNILLKQIETCLKNTKNIYKVLIIDDNSSEKNIFKLNKNKFFKDVSILSLKKNVGSQKAIATCLKFISKNKNKNEDKFIIMDSDGEDDPKKIKEIIKLIDKDPNIEIITMKRSIRKESFFFALLYEVHLLITFLTTFKYIRFGNFSFLNKKIVNKISKKEELWFAYSATLKKYFNLKNSIIAPRRNRISGKSKMSYFALINHSLSIQLVYIKSIIFSQLFYSSIILYLYFYKSFDLIIFLFLPIISQFFLMMFVIQKRINGVTFNNCLNNINFFKKI